ncbi:YdcH family protein (plasmid) [Nitrobacter sp. NHB1]|uniref:YdcH family protein n=1 Tax=Nitrobacter sp. NHB1 TaxID=3119830 RepID=UPI002FFF890D
MSNTPHTLRDEFPDQMDTIHALKVANPEFARILEEYDEVNDQIHRAETRIESISEETEVTLRKKRLALKDKIASALNKRGA